MKSETSFKSFLSKTTQEKQPQKYCFPMRKCFYGYSQNTTGPSYYPNHSSYKSIKQMCGGVGLINLAHCSVRSQLTQVHWRHRALFNACGNHYDPNSTLCTGYCTDRRNPSIVAFFQDKYFADEFIRLISTISHLVAPLLHLDTLTIVNSVLFVVTSSQLHLMSIFFALRTFVPVA